MKKPRIYIETLIQLMDRAESFSEKFLPSYRDHFRMAHFVLWSKDLKFEMDEVAVGALVNSYRFSSNSEDFFRDCWETLKEYDEKSWDDDQKKYFLVYLFTDIFRGMGSWCDNGSFSNSKDKLEYEEITEELHLVRAKIETILNLEV